MYMYIYIYVCVCVIVMMISKRESDFKKRDLQYNAYLTITNDGDTIVIPSS